MRKQKFWFPNWSATNQAVQLQKMARGLKFQIKKVEGLYYLCSKNKGADQLRRYREAVTAKLICVFVFAYAKPWFSDHDTSHFKPDIHTFYSRDTFHSLPDLHIIVFKREEFPIGLDLVRGLVYC